jgi:hypothetical protein
MRAVTVVMPQSSEIAMVERLNQGFRLAPESGALAMSGEDGQSVK